MNARDRLQAGRAATYEDRFEEALAHFVWFHEHALQEDVAYYGVRLSFALSYWLELAERYPPAMANYRAKLDDKVTRLLGGEFSRDLFHDIDAMNGALDADERTADIFAVLDATQPEFALSCARIAVPALIRAKHYALAAKYVPEPEAQVLAMASELVDRVKKIEARPRTKAPRYRAFLQNFSGDLLQMEELLLSTGREGQARQLRLQVLAALKPAYLRNAVAKLLAVEP